MAEYETMTSASSDEALLLDEPSDLVIVDDHHRQSNGQPTQRKYKALVFILTLVCAILTVTLCIIVLQHKDTTNKKKRDIVTKDLIYFFQVSDTHLDLYYNSNITNINHQACRNVTKLNSTNITLSKTVAKFGRFKCDTPDELMVSVETHMKSINDQLEHAVEFVLITGDQSAHAYENFDVNEKDSTVWSIGNSTKYFSRLNVPVFPALGNNDLYMDYQPPVNNNSDLYKRIGDTIEEFVFLKNHQVSIDNSVADFRKTFHFGGYYSVFIKARKLMLIILNTNYWNTDANNHDTSIGVIGQQQLKWLYSQLVVANNTNYKVIIAGHIPPGCDPYNDRGYWVPRFTNVYLLMTSEQFPNIISAQIFAHSHTDRMRMLYMGDQFPLVDTKSHSKSAIFITPSVTPIFGNSPAYRLFSMTSKEGNLNDYVQYFMDLTISNIKGQSYWAKEYSFNELYNTTFNVNDMEKLVEELILPSSTTWFKYMSHMKSTYGGMVLSQRYKEYCAAKHISLEAYKYCLKYYQNTGAELN